MENISTTQLTNKWYFKQWFINVLIIIFSMTPALGIAIIPLLYAKNKNIRKALEPLIQLQNTKIAAEEMIKIAEIKVEEIANEHLEEINTLEKKLANKEEEYQKIVKEATAEAHTNLGQLGKDIENLTQQKKNLQEELKKVNSSLIELNDEALYQSFALYEPMYDFVNSESYKTKLDAIRNEQKALIKQDKAATGATNWTVNNSTREGQKMVNDTKKLLLRAFNNECDFAINKVNYRNFEASKKRISTAYTAISKLGRVMYISISPEYFDLKIQELHLAFEYEEAKQKEKERLQELRAEQRELAKLQKELEAERLKIKKEKMHYATAITATKEQLAMCTDDAQRVELNEKLQKLEHEAEEIDKNLVDIDYRAANERAGYVYIISNIGAFGPDVYKIGMTRRLEPMDRINELGDASVPFKFDVHALIFSEDAPTLETALHQAFDKSKINMVNPRREFFKVKLEEIMKVVKENFDGTVDFIKIPEATQYRESIKLRESIS